MPAWDAGWEERARLEADARWEAEHRDAELAALRDVEQRLSSAENAHRSLLAGGVSATAAHAARLIAADTAFERQPTVTVHIRRMLATSLELAQIAEAGGTQAGIAAVLRRASSLARHASAELDDEADRIEKGWPQT